jgi:hypothetical protein
MPDGIAERLNYRLCPGVNKKAAVTSIKKTKVKDGIGMAGPKVHKQDLWG